MKDIKVNSVSIGKASEILGVSIQTLRNWHRSGKLVPEYVSVGGTRMYSLYELERMKGYCVTSTDKVTIAYARVSTNSQAKDLERQVELLESYCCSKGYRYRIIRDLGSGLNYNKKGLSELIELICLNKIDRVILVHKDRLLRFGSEIVFKLCAIFKVEVVILNEGEASNPNEELANDVLEIITVFSAKLYGMRSHKSIKMINDLKKNLPDNKDNSNEKTKEII